MDLPRPLQAGPIHLIGWLNRLRLFVQKMTNIQGSEFIHVKHGPSGHRVDLALAKLIERIPKGEPGLTVTDLIQVFKITGLGDNTLTCRAYSESDGANDPNPGSNETVLKMRPLQDSSYDGLTLDGITFTGVDSATRTADDGTYTWTERVVNPYAINQIIVAANIPFDQSEETYRWQEVDIYGRVWARDDSTITEA